MDTTGVGKLLLVMAGVLALFGLVFVLTGKGTIPRLPGDLSFGKGNFRVFVPLGSSIVLSVLITIVLNLFLRR